MRAREDGELGPDRDLRALARYLVSSLNGLRVITEAIDDPKTVGDIISGSHLIERAFKICY